MHSSFKSLFVALAPLVCLAQSTMPPDADQRLARDIYKEIIEIKSGFTTGSTTPVAEAIQRRLRSAGFPDSDIFVGGVIPKKANIVVRYHGSGKLKPVLLLAHTDVVEAKREDWSMDPFTFTEKDGYFYGRGTSDDKDGAAILVATLARLKQEGYRPNRDLILALTTGEEGGSDYNGVEWLLANHRDLIDAAFVINMDAGDPVVLNGKRLMRTVQASEKVYVTFKLEVHNPGGHSSLPTKDNAI